RDHLQAAPQTVGVACDAGTGDRAAAQRTGGHGATIEGRARSGSDRTAHRARACCPIKVSAEHAGSNAGACTARAASGAARASTPRAGSTAVETVDLGLDRGRVAASVRARLARDFPLEF